MSVLGFRQRHVDPDLPPRPEPDASPHQRAFFENGAARPACTCRVFDAIGQNPECAKHPWWGRDPAVLDLADLTRELGSALKAAQAKFGGER